MKSQKSKTQLGCLGLKSTASSHSIRASDAANSRKGSIIGPQLPQWTIGHTNMQSQSVHANKESLFALSAKENLLAGWKSERKRENSKAARVSEEATNENHIIADSKSIRAAFKKKLRKEATKRPSSLDKQQPEHRSLTPPQTTEPVKPIKVQSFLTNVQNWNSSLGPGMFSQRTRGQNDSTTLSIKQKVIPGQSSPRSFGQTDGQVISTTKSKNGVKVSKSKQMSLQVNNNEVGNPEIKRAQHAKTEVVVGRRSASIGKKLATNTPPASPHHSPVDGLLTAISPLFKTQLQLQKDNLLGSHLSSCGSMSSPFAETRTRATQGCSYNSGLSKQSPEHLKTFPSEFLPKKCVWHPSKQARFFTRLDQESMLLDLHCSGGSLQQEALKSSALGGQSQTGGNPLESTNLKSATCQLMSGFDDPAGMQLVCVCSICAVRLAQKGHRLEEIPLEHERHEEQQQVLFEFQERTKLLTELAGIVEKSIKTKLSLVQQHYKQQFEVLMCSAAQIDDLYNKIQLQLAQINQSMIEESQAETRRLTAAKQNLKPQKVELMKLSKSLEMDFQEGLEQGDIEDAQKRLSRYNETLLQIGDECKRAFECRCEVTSIQMCEMTLGNIEAKFQDLVRCKRKEVRPNKEQQLSGETFLTTLERLECLGKSTRTRLTVRGSSDNLSGLARLEQLHTVNSLAEDHKDQTIIPTNGNIEKELACVSFEGTMAGEKVEFSGSKEYGEVLRRIDDNQSLNLHYYSSLMQDYGQISQNDIQTPELGGVKDQLPFYLQSHLQALLAQNQSITTQEQSPSPMRLDTRPGSVIEESKGAVEMGAGAKSHDKTSTAATEGQQSISGDKMGPKRIKSGKFSTTNQFWTPAATSAPKAGVSYPDSES